MKPREQLLRAFAVQVALKRGELPPSEERHGYECCCPSCRECQTPPLVYHGCAVTHYLTPPAFESPAPTVGSEKHKLSGSGVLIGVACGALLWLAVAWCVVAAWRIVQ